MVFKAAVCGAVKLYFFILTDVFNLSSTSFTVYTAMNVKASLSTTNYSLLK